MSKIENSVHLEHINSVLLNGKMSLGELVLDLHKKGFKVSKSTLATHKTKLSSDLIISDELDNELETAKQTKISNVKETHKANRDIMTIMYNKAIENTFLLTTKAINNNRVLPLHSYKSIIAIQSILNGCEKLIKDSKDTGDILTDE